MVAPTVLPGRAHQQIDAVSRLAFHWRAQSLGLDTVSSASATFARTSAGGLVADANNNLVRASADGVHRFTWADADQDGSRETAGLVVEASRTNAWTQSRALDNAAWTKTNSTITQDDRTAPDGSSTMDKIVEDNTASAQHGVTRNTPSLTDSTTSTVSAFVRGDERTILYIETNDKGGTQRRSWFNTSTGAWGTTNAGHTTHVEAFGDSVYRISVGFDSSSGGSTPSAGIYLADADNSATYNGDNSSGAHCWGVQFETDQAAPTSFIPTTSSTVTRAAESIYWTFNLAPQSLSVYLKFIERGTASDEAGGGIFHIGNAAGSGARIDLEESSGAYRLLHYNGSASVTSTHSTSPSYLDTVEILATVSSAGAVQISQALNGGATSSASASASNALPSAWAGTRAYLGSLGSSTIGLNEYLVAKVATGVRNMTYMREAF